MWRKQEPFAFPLRTRRREVKSAGTVGAILARRRYGLAISPFSYCSVSSSPGTATLSRHPVDDTQNRVPFGAA